MLLVALIPVAYGVGFLGTSLLLDYLESRR